MGEPQPGRGLDLGAAPPGRDRARPVALGLGAVWVAAVGAYGAGLALGEGPGPSGLAALLLLLAAAGPVALIGAGAAMLARAEALRAETAALRTEVRALASATGRAQGGNQALVKAAAEAARTAAAVETTGLAPRLEAIEAGVAALAARLEALAAPSRPEKKTEAARAAAPADQPALPFAEAAAREPATVIPWSDVVRALDFPRHADDAEGFAAIRSALRDPEIARLLQASEDVLTMLAAGGVHMEDLKPEPASLATWRAYAEGARGARVAAAGGIIDEAALGVARARLREDPVFRDACLVFVRRWSTLVARVFRELSEDPVMLEIADSRSGRAFMLAARALGAFD